MSTKELRIRGYLMEIECLLAFALHTGNPKARELVVDLLEKFGVGATDARVAMSWST